MATLAELTTTLLRRFRNVPNVELEDATDWVTLAMAEHGFEAEDDVPTELVTLILLYAEADGAGAISLYTAHYFSYKDGEESVDKRGVSEQYRKVATELWKKYERKRADSPYLTGATRFSIMKRADRP